ncbi:unnamed protein product [Plutella xylostella]|uniref:Elongator complex protein 5 n=1 Tax=Plutella xylostella TaxID=51655 RepID=A0A8S4DTP6_PLUXY|nr:unnamed protein product [Plutella xylostella]
MVLGLGWKACLKYLIKLQRDPNVGQLIAILHKDCLTHSSKLQVHLNHIANAIISYNSENHSKISIVIRKSGKFYRSEELLSYDNKTRTLKSIPIIKESKKSEDEPARPSPSNLTTFKIEMDQSEKLEKYKLKLPYMSKINEGEGKVFYEPDAVDDWDEEDPDEDLDI